MVMKPAPFVECSVCGREFGSKSIVIHERQCLQKLRRTEIATSTAAEDELVKKKNAKNRSHTSVVAKSSRAIATAAAAAAASDSDVLITPFGKTLDVMATDGNGGQAAAAMLLPTLHNNPHNHHQVQRNTSRARQKTSTLLGNSDRPSTVTLSRPKILNLDFIQYDMSLTRIDNDGAAAAVSSLTSLSPTKLKRGNKSRGGGTGATGSTYGIMELDVNNKGSAPFPDAANLFFPAVIQNNPAVAVATDNKQRGGGGGGLRRDSIRQDKVKLPESNSLFSTFSTMLGGTDPFKKSSVVQRSPTSSSTTTDLHLHQYASNNNNNAQVRFYTSESPILNNSSSSPPYCCTTPLPPLNPSLAKNEIPSTTAPLSNVVVDTLINFPHIRNHTNTHQRRRKTNATRQPATINLSSLYTYNDLTITSESNNHATEHEQLQFPRSPPRPSSQQRTALTNVIGAGGEMFYAIASNTALSSNYDLPRPATAPPFSTRTTMFEDGEPRRPFTALPPSTTKGKPSSSPCCAHDSKVIDGLLSAVFRIKEIKKKKTRIYKFSDHMTIECLCGSNSQGDQGIPTMKMRKKKNEGGLAHVHRPMTSPPLDQQTKNALNQLPVEKKKHRKWINPNLRRPKTSPPIMQSQSPPQLPLIQAKKTNIFKMATVAAKLNPKPQQEPVVSLKSNNKRPLTPTVKPKYFVPSKPATTAQQQQKTKMVTKTKRTAREEELNKNKGNGWGKKVKTDASSQHPERVTSSTQISSPLPILIVDTSSTGDNTEILPAEIDDEEGRADKDSIVVTAAEVAQLENEESSSSTSSSTSSSPKAKPITFAELHQRFSPRLRRKNSSSTPSVNAAAASEKKILSTSSKMTLYKTENETHQIYRLQPIDPSLQFENLETSGVGGADDILRPTSSYTLMMPKQLEEEVSTEDGATATETGIDLNVIVRRETPDGHFPDVQTVVPSYLQDWMYLIIDEQQQLSSSTSTHSSTTGDSNTITLTPESSTQSPLTENGDIDGDVEKSFTPTRITDEGDKNYSVNVKNVNGRRPSLAMIVQTSDSEESLNSIISKYCESVLAYQRSMIAQQEQKKKKWLAKIHHAEEEDDGSVLLM